MSATKLQAHRTQAYQQSIEEALLALGTEGRRGLSEAEARARLEKYGMNELTAEKPVPAWRKFLAQFQDVLVILLLVATMISAGLWLFERESILPYEAMAIFAVVLLNAVMGYIQESRAEEAVAALRQMSAAHANIIRDGARQSVQATEVVPGDIILIEEGDTVPADARVIQSTALQTAEAALAGESLPVSKDTLPITEEVGLGDRHNMLFSGTAATYGRGRAVVIATGMQTQMGLIAGMLKDTPTETTPLQKELARVGRLLGLIVAVIAVVMIATIILVEDVRGFAALFDVLILGVALAVAEVWLPPPPRDEVIDDTFPFQIPAGVKHARVRAARIIGEAQDVAERGNTRVQRIFPQWTVSHEALSGSPAFELLTRAKEWQPELIVVGSHGHTALGRFFLGSVSQKVLTEAQTSVRVARRTTGAAASAERIVVGCDGSPGSQATLRQVAARNWTPDSEVRIIVAEDLMKAFPVSLIVPPVNEFVDRLIKRPGYH